MAHIISVMLQKGGTGKTSTAINLGAALQERGKRVLLIDLDPQGNLSQVMGLTNGKLVSNRTIYTAIQQYVAESTVDLPIYATDTGMDVVPASARLNRANEELVAVYGREQVIKSLLAPYLDRYDYILLDTLPYLGVLVVGAMVASHSAILPVQSEFLPAESTVLTLDEVDTIRKRLNPDLKVLGLLLTMVSNNNLHREAVRFARNVLGQRAYVFETVIKRSVKMAESQAARQTILQYEPRGELAQSYRALAVEVMERES